MRKLEDLNPAPSGPGPYAGALARFGAELATLKDHLATLLVNLDTAEKRKRKGTH